MLELTQNIQLQEKLLVDCECKQGKVQIGFISMLFQVRVHGGAVDHNPHLKPSCCKEQVFLWFACSP